MCPTCNRVSESLRLTTGIGPSDDDFHALSRAARELFEESDALVLSAGSSVSVRDMTGDVIAGLGGPGVLVHGVSIKPGKPTILAVCNGKPVIGLPGNPASAMVVGDLFITSTRWRLQGCDRPPRRNAVTARLSHQILPRGPAP